MTTLISTGDVAGLHETYIYVCGRKGRATRLNQFNTGSAHNSAPSTRQYIFILCNFSVLWSLSYVFIYLFTCLFTLTFFVVLWFPQMMIVQKQSVLITLVLNTHTYHVVTKAS